MLMKMDRRWLLQMFYLLLQMFLPCWFSPLCPGAWAGHRARRKEQETSGQVRHQWDKSQIKTAPGDSLLFPSLPRSFHAAQVEIFPAVTMHRFV